MVSRSADACPSCGARLKKRWYEAGCLTVIVGVLVGFGLLILIGVLSG